MAGENLNPDPANEGNGELKKEVEGLKAAAVAERRKRQEAETRAAHAEGQVQGLSNRPNGSDAPKEVSTAELRTAVDEGRMTEAEAEGIRDRQSERRIETKLTGKFEDVLSSRQMTERVGTEIGRYKTAVPEIADQDSVQFTKARGEFDYLVSLGHDPKDPRTELQAARAAFGSIESLEAVGEKRPRETYSETGGGADPDDAGDDNSGWPKAMNADSRRYYQDLINKGVYSDRKAAVEEFSYKPKHGPRHAA